MDAKTTGIVSYLTIIGWVIALATGDKSEASKFHINQALVLMLGAVIASALSWLPYFGNFLSAVGGIFIFVLWIISFIGACQGEQKVAPIIGTIKLMK